MFRHFIEVGWVTYASLESCAQKLVMIVDVDNQNRTLVDGSPSASQLLAFSPGKEQAAGVWET